MEETTMMAQRAEKMLSSRLPKAMQKRGAIPLLDFRGGIIGPAAGLLTYDDGQLIEAKFQELTEAQANISLLLGQQTHLVRSQLEGMRNQAQQHQERLNSFKNELANLNQELDQAARKVAELKYTKAFTRVLQATEAAVEEYIRLVDRLLSVIRVARQKGMRPGISTPKQLEPTPDQINEKISGEKVFENNQRSVE